MSQLIPLSQPALALPALVMASADCAYIRFLEFFAANIRNPHTLRFGLLSHFVGYDGFRQLCARASRQSA
jgi:hypothetical protein